MRAGPGATMWAARGAAQAGARYPGIGPTSGHGRPLRDGGALGLPGLVARPRRDPLPEAPRSVGTSSTPPSWPPMCTPRWRNWFRWRLEESADPFSVLESGSDSQCTCLILMFYLPWFVTGLTLTLRALCVQFSAARPVWLSWSCSQNHPPRSRGIRARPPFAVWHTVCE